MTTITINRSHLDETLAAERPRLLGLCTYLTGDPDSAEDVVQEVMLEAWRSFAKLRDPNAIDAWLNGIVRNVCARWQRARGREAAVMLPIAQQAVDAAAVVETVADDFDLEVELDRQELALLVDRALALLPATTREVLIGKYIAESPHAELAQRLGLTENAVAVRLHRGKLALHKLLTTQLRTEAETFGLVTPADQWVETRLWCPVCGQRRLMGKLAATELIVRCPTCASEPKSKNLHANWAGSASPFGQAKSFRPILKRLAARWYQTYTQVIAQGEYVCPRCHSSSPLQRQWAGDIPSTWSDLRGLVVFCQQCNTEDSSSLAGIVMSSPEGVDFYQKHPRIRQLPDREIVLQGAPAIVLSSASVTDPATFDVIVHRDTFAILAIHSPGDP